MSFLNRIKDTKTLKAVIGGLLIAVGSFLGGAMDFGDLLNAVFLCVLSLTGRDAVKKVEPPAQPDPVNNAMSQALTPETWNGHR